MKFINSAFTRKNPPELRFHAVELSQSRPNYNILYHINIRYNLYMVSNMKVFQNVKQNFFFKYYSKEEKKINNKEFAN